MKKQRKIVPVLLMILITSGCAGKADRFQYEYDSLENIIHNADAALGDTYQNLIMPDTISIPNYSSLYEFSTRTYDEPATDDVKKQVLARFVESMLGEIDTTSIRFWNEGASFYYYGHL